MSYSCLYDSPSVQKVKAELQNIYPNFTENDIMAIMRAAADKYHKSEPTVDDVKRYQASKPDSVFDDSSIKEATRKEMQAIKKKAIADGTFMLAPNGKPTNLTERQWLQVRTKAFKRWFGDWEKAAAENEAVNAYKESKDRLYLLGKEANLFFKNIKDRDKINNLVNEFFSDIEKAGNDPSMLEMLQDSIQHQLGVTEEEALDLIAALQNAQHYIQSGDVKYLGHTNASKVVDENGEPLVVYHGTGKTFSIFNSKYTGTNTAEFSKSKVAKEFYFTPAKEEAYYYGKVIMPLFLNIRNPFVDMIMAEDVGKTVDTIYKEHDGAYLGINEGLESPHIVPEYVVFNSNQIKSAESNNGDFSESTDIYEDVDAEPHIFTFNDGTEVTTPFVPNEQQVEALNQIDAFIKSDETSMTLSGYAGTGKTSLMEIIAAKLRYGMRSIVFTATTNKAAGVLKSRVKRLGYDAVTLNKAFGIMVEQDSNNKIYDAKELATVVGEAKVEPQSVVVIDEASMINEENYKVINEIAKAYQLKIIYLGDEAQLSPVNEKNISIVFRNPKNRVVRLTKVERTGDNAILKEATALRNNQQLSGESSFNSKGQGVAYIRPNDWSKISDIIKYFIPKLKENPDFFRVLAYRNDTVAKYNTIIRRELGYDSYIPRVGEPILGYNNWGYAGGRGKKTNYRFINSESYVVKSVGNPRAISYRLEDGTVVSLSAVPITIEDSMGTTDTMNVIDIKGNPTNRAAVIKLAKEKQRLWSMWNATQSRAYIQRANEIDNFLFVNDEIIDENVVNSKGKHPTIVTKVFDFGYAMTVHKSQGSTFTHVLLDAVDIAAGSANSSNTNANVKQQLEYVGVSRATDTVTILSNNIKTEGSPIPINAPVNPTEAQIPSGLTKEQVSGIKAETARLTEIIKNSLKSVERERLRATDAAQTALTQMPIGAKLSATEVLEMVAKDDTATRQERALAVALIPIFAKTKITVDFSNIGQLAGQVTSIGTKIESVTLNPNSFKFKRSSAKVALHELTHALTVSRLAADSEFKAEIKKLIDKVKDFLKDKNIPETSTYIINGNKRTLPFDIYGLKNESEFLAEAISNESFQKLLSEIPVDSEKSAFQNFIDKVIETLKKLFNITYKQDASILTEVLPMIADTISVTADKNLINFGGILSSNWQRERTEDQLKDAANIMQALEDAYTIAKEPEKINPQIAEFYSGAAPGSDTDWGTEARNLGIVVTDYTVEDYRKLSPERKAVIDKEYSEARAFLGKPELTGYSGELTRRDMLQADKADAIFAIAQSITPPDGTEYSGGKAYINKSGHDNVSGGTANAVARGIIRGIPVYVYDQSEKQWKQWNNTTKSFVPITEPTLTPHAATIGTREINDDGRAAIRTILQNSVAGQQQTQEPIDINKISDKTEAFNVEVSASSSDMWQKIKGGWQQSHPTGIVAYRRRGDKPETFSAVAVSSGWIGNPFSTASKDADTVQKFFEWLTTGNNFGETERANEPFRQAIIQKILATPTDAPVLYYTELGRPSHATVIGYLIQNKQLLQNAGTLTRPQTPSQPSTQPQVPTVVKREAPKEEPLTGLSLPNVNRAQYDEEVIRILGSTDKKKARIDLIVTMFSSVVDNLIDAEQKQTGAKVHNRKQWIIDHLSDILGKRTVVNGQEEFVPGELTALFDDPESVDEETFAAFCQFNMSHNPNVWMALIEEAAPYIQDIEGVVIQTRNSADPYQEGEEEWEASGENILSLRDGWMIRAREVDLRDNLSDKVRRLLARIPLTQRKDVNGDPIYEYDDLGFMRYITPDYAHVKLLTELAEATDADSFDEALEKLAKNIPWVEYVIQKLNEDEVLKAAFYGDLRKEFISYWVHTKGKDGTTKTNEVNREPSVQYLFNDWMHKYDSHIILSSISAFDKDGGVNTDNLTKILDVVKEINKLLPVDRSSEEFDYSEDSPLVDNLQKLFRSVGIDLTKSQINLSIETSSGNKNAKVTQLVQSVNDIIRGLQKEPLKPGGPFSSNNYKSAYTKIAEELNIIPEGVTMNSFRERGKSYQSFANPSWIGRFVTTMHTDRADDYIEKQYGKFRQFRVNGKWRGAWLQLLTGQNKEVYRKLLQRKVVLHSNTKEYDKWTSKDYFDIMFNEFLSTNDKNSANYYLPILADAPSAEFIKFVRYSGSNYKTDITNGLYITFVQELERIWLVQERKRQNAEKIQNLDREESEKFLFFPGLNTADKNGLMRGQEGYQEGTSFLEEYKRLREQDKQIRERGGTSSAAEALAKTAIRNEMELGFQNFLDEVEQYGYSRENKTLENYYWNNALAYVNIVQLTTADIAYYKGITDFQKRYKQVYSMTQRLYTNATWEGKLVGKRDDDGNVYENVVTLKDIIAPSRVLDEIKAVVRNQVKAGRLTKLEGDYIVSQFNTVNATDAQAWRSLDSFRDIMIMAGKWTEEMQTAFDHLNSDKQGDWTVADFNTMWLTIKPFLFSLSSTDSEVTLPDGTPYGQIPCPKQFKNSEMLLLALYGKIAMKESASPMLRAISRVMRGDAFVGTQSAGTTIDVVQFESTEKVGGQAAINLNGYIKGGVIHILNEDGELEETIEWGGKHKEGKYVTVDGKVIDGAEAIIDNEEAMMKIFRTKLNKKDENTGKLYMYDKAVKRVSMEDYGIQVTSPEHLLDHEGIIQSQFKKHIAANLPGDFSCTVGGKTYTGEDVYNTIQAVLTENILEGYKECEELFGSKEAVEKELQKQMAGNKRYTAEDKKACTLVTKPDGTKDWAVPLFDPIQSQRIQSLLLSVIKKKVVNPKMRRAYLVQATGVGFSDDLQVRYYDVNGNFLFNRKEFEGTEKARPKYRELLHQMRKKYKTYDEYVKANPKDANAVAYHEIAMPLPSKSWMDWCYDPETGTFDIDKLDDRLREGVGLRSPNEAKYSSQPVYLKYLLPSNNGSIVMYPDEITRIVGADFDYDKIMLYLHEFYVEGALRKEYMSLPKKERDVWEKPIENVDEINDRLLGEDFEPECRDLDTKQRVGFVLWCAYMEETYPEQYNAMKSQPGRPVMIDYDVDKAVSTMKKDQRNNLFLDLAFAVLTNPTVSAQMHSPGNFDILKHEKNVKEVLRNLTFDEIVKELGITRNAGEKDDEFKKRVYEQLNETDTKVLKKLVGKYEKVLDPKSVQTQLYFHRQNSNASNMIGIYAVAGGSHSLLQHTKTVLKQPVTIFGETITQIDPMVIPFGKEKGKLLSKNIEQFLAASVDDVKDPVLAALMQNPNTANITNGLIRMGFPISIATSMVVAKNYAYHSDTETANPSEQITETELMELIQMQAQDKLGSELHAKALAGELDYEDAVKETFTREERLHLNELMLKLENTLNVVTPICDDIQNLTLMLRSDAPNNAAGPTVGHVLGRFIKLVESSRRYALGTIVSDAYDYKKIIGPDALVWRETPSGRRELAINWDRAVDYVCSQTDNISVLRGYAQDSSIPFIQAATVTGVLGPIKLMRDYFPQLSPNFIKVIVNQDYGLTGMINFGMVNMDEAAATLNKIVNEYMVYSLNKTAFFGTMPSSNEKLSKSKIFNAGYFMLSFPDQVLEFLNKHQELVNTNLFISGLEFPIKNGVRMISFRDAKDLSNTQKSQVTDSWAELALSDDEEVRNIATLLFKYGSFLGITYSGPHSFVHMAPSMLRSSITDYNAGLNLALNIPSTEDGMYFINQFIKNNYSKAGLKKITPKSLKDYQKDSDEITVTSIENIAIGTTTVENEGNLEEQPLFASRIVLSRKTDSGYIDELFVRDHTILDSKNNVAGVVYKKQSTLGINGFKEYYAGQADPQSVLDYYNRRQYNVTTEGSEGEENGGDGEDYGYPEELDKADFLISQQKPKPIETPMQPAPEQDPATGEDICARAPQDPIGPSGAIDDWLNNN